MMISNEEIIQILNDNSELGTIGWTVEEAMFEDVAKQIQGKVQNLNIDLVISTLRVCATGCNGIVVNGVCNSCKADWR